MDLKTGWFLKLIYNATEIWNSTNILFLELKNETGLIKTPFSSILIKKFIDHIKLLRTLLKYMIPLFFVYFGEYFINQGLFELVYFKDSFIKKHSEQYRWYNVAYQLAVFISRTSIALFQIKFLSIFPIFQMINVVLVLSQIFFGYITSIWIVFLIIFWEGLLGGLSLNISVLKQK